jgi:transcriptional regulator with XRE-family HTH domain
MTDNQEPRSAVFRRKVAELREQHGWSQAALGRRVGLGQSRMATIEKTGSVTIDQAQAFADALGVPIEVLLYEKPPAAEEVYIRQVQRLNKIGNAVWDHREEINRLTAEILAELAGKHPRGKVITSDSVFAVPDLDESE